jgi:hypothetical protein
LPGFKRKRPRFHRETAFAESHQINNPTNHIAKPRRNPNPSMGICPPQASLLRNLPDFLAN